MPVDPDADELAAVVAAIKATLDRDRYPRAPRLAPLRSALAKFDPSVVRPVADPKPPLPAGPRIVKGDKARRRRG